MNNTACNAMQHYATLRSTTDNKIQELKTFVLAFWFLIGSIMQRYAAHIFTALRAFRRGQSKVAGTRQKGSKQGNTKISKENEGRKQKSKKNEGRETK